jgi:hypothetical protein
MRTDKPQLKVGAEIILSVIVAPFFIWVVQAIFNLQASGSSDTLRFEQIKSMLEKQEQKIDHITDILITKGH